MSLQATMFIAPVGRIQCCKRRMLGRKSLCASYNRNRCAMQNETILMISIFLEAYPLYQTKVSPEEYLDQFGFEIDWIGRVLKCLGLAQPATQSDFGWKPVPMLMKIIAERAARP